MYRITFVSKDGEVLEFFIENTVMLVKFCKLTDIPEEDILESLPYLNVFDGDKTIVEEVDLVLSTPEVTNKIKG